MDFSDVALEPPFVISGRSLTHVTMARVILEMRRVDGVTARGTGASMLSVQWAWPAAEIDVQACDRVLRSLVRRFTDQFLGATAGGDPFALWCPIYEDLDETLAQAAREAGVSVIPRLAGLLALGAVDDAVHDAWSRAAHRSAYAMYTADHLRDDVSWVVPELTGVYSGDYLEVPRSIIPIQHALGVGDPLTDDEAVPGVRSLEQWVRTDGIRHLKLSGDSHRDAERIAAVHEVAAGFPGTASTSLDPNEAYEPEQPTVRLDELDRNAPAARAAITYLEQPFSTRGFVVDPEQMRRLSARFPVLIDEGYPRLDQLAGFREQGWSGW